MRQRNTGGKASMFSANWKKEIFTIPNLLSLFRIILIPIYMNIYLDATEDHQYFLAGSILAVSCLTDMVDGFIARKFHMITNVGKVLDPLADKLTQLALILSLSAKYTVLYPVLALFLVKELFQGGSFVFFARKGKVLPGALWAGKVCTTVLFLSLILLVLFPRIPDKLVLFLTLVDAGFLLYSFTSYTQAYFGKKSALTDLE